MASKKLGNLIKEARTEAGFTQEQLARKIAGLSATDISEAERGLKDLTQEQLKKIAKATGVTQASLLDAAKGTKKSTSTAAKTSMKVTATEKRLVELYREADSETKKRALSLLRGNNVVAEELLDTLMDGVSDLFSGK
jgi:transcriptional regulator with XRE-family HTH domain